LCFVVDMSDVPSTFDELIGEWGIATVASVLSVPYSTANAMKQRNSVPPRYWAQLLAQAPAGYKLSPARLLDIEAKSRQAVQREAEARQQAGAAA
jgi:hypothetical protein